MDRIRFCRIGYLDKFYPSRYPVIQLPKISALATFYASLHTFYDLHTYFQVFAHFLHGLSILNIPAAVMHGFHAVKATSPLVDFQPLSVLFSLQIFSLSEIFTSFASSIPSKYLPYDSHVFCNTYTPSIPLVCPLHHHTPPPSLTRPLHRLHTFHNHLHTIAASAVSIDRHVAMAETAFLGNLKIWNLGYF